MIMSCRLMLMTFISTDDCRSRSFYLHCGDCPVDGEMLAFLRVFSMDEGRVDCIGRHEKLWKVTLGLSLVGDHPVRDALLH